MKETSNDETRTNNNNNNNTTIGVIITENASYKV